MTAPELETIAAAAARKSVSVSTLRALIRRRRLPAVRIRGTRIVRVRIADVDALFQEDSAAAAVPLRAVGEG